MFDNTMLSLSSRHGSGGSSFGHAVERGAGWGLGRDLESVLFHLLPATLVVVAALLGAAFLAYRWVKNRQQRPPGS